ncbi:MAG: hypothetical protein JXR25_14685 [Pontiellaceae bacterium]|nr:hypothetical protein [Pontiellaceae bacterium]MBN2786066.1 hypothetical protein [Pontiellaceae bacterium]
MNTEARSKRKRGYALLIGLFFVSLMSLGSMMLLQISRQKVYSESLRADAARARLVAEGGVHWAYAAIEREDATVESAFDDIVIGDGVASVSISEVDEATGSALSSTSSGDGRYYLMDSVGSSHDREEKAAVLMKQAGSGSGAGVDEEVLALFDGVIFCGGDLRMVGGTYIDLDGSSAHANGSITMTGSANFQGYGSVSSSTEIDLSGGNAKIYGNAVAPVISVPSWAKWMAPDYFITGSQVVAEVPEQMIELDLEPFRVYAAANDIPGQSYKSTAWNYVFTDSYFSEDEMPNNGKLTIAACQTVRPSSGVLWVEGDITFAGSSVVQGCIIATGDIKVCGGMEDKPDGGLPSFMSLNGDVEIASGCTVYGLVYAHNGEIKISGDADVEGAFICPRGNFTNCGSGKVIYDNSRPSGPGGISIMLPAAEGGEGGGVAEVVRWVL